MIGQDRSLEKNKDTSLKTIVLTLNYTEFVLCIIFIVLQFSLPLQVVSDHWWWHIEMADSGS